MQSQIVNIGHPAAFSSLILFTSQISNLVLETKSTYHAFSGFLAHLRNIRSLNGSEGLFKESSEDGNFSHSSLPRIAVVISCSVALTLLRSKVIIYCTLIYLWHSTEYLMTLLKCLLS